MHSSSKTFFRHAGTLIQQEPLLQFLFLASLVFLLSYFLSSTPDDETLITVPTQDIESFISDYESNYGNPPNQKELSTFKQQWIEDEILYREGLSLMLDKHDTLVRQRVIKKMKLLLSGSEQFVASDDELTSFMKSNKELYNDPAEFSFYMAKIDSNTTLNLASSDYRKLLLTALENGGDPALMGLQLSHLENKRPGYLNGRFGPGFAATLKQFTQQPSWQTINVNGIDYVIKLTSYRPEKLPNLDTIRTRVLKDWRKQQSKLRLDNRLLALQQNYAIE